MANLCMMNMWHSLLYRAPSSSSNDYFLKSFPYRLAVGPQPFLTWRCSAPCILPFIVLAGEEEARVRLSRASLSSRCSSLPVDRILLFGRSFYGRLFPHRQ